jgi:hypothetical protein
MIVEHVLQVAGLDVWFTEQLNGLQCSPETRAYVVSVLKAQGHPLDGAVFAGRNSSVIIAYQEAVVKNDFAAYQRIGDWVLWVDAMCPDSLRGKHEVVENFGRLAYYSCHRILRGQWHIYEELADNLPVIARRVRSKLI